MQYISTNGSSSLRSSPLLLTAVAGAIALALQAQALAQAPVQAQSQAQMQPQAQGHAAQHAREQQKVQPQAQGQQQMQPQRQAGATASQRQAEAANVTGSSWAKQQGLRASRVIGSSVRNPQGQEIGQIEDVVLNVDSGKVRFAVLRFDPGFLSFERVYAVPVERLRYVDDQVVIDIPRERLEQSGIENAGWSKDYFKDRARLARMDKDWGLGERAPEHLVRASDLMNSPIVSASGGERIGTIEELVFAPGRQQVQYVVVSFDRGWLGADKRAAVAVDSLHRNADRDTLALVVDRTAVRNMRPFTEDRYSYFGDGGFVNRESRRTMGAPAAAPAR